MPSSDGFYRSGQAYAQDALEAHHQQQFGRAALFAGTALEHLMKSCLVRRSPALITAITREEDRDFASMVRLLGLTVVKRPAQTLRTVGLRGALNRVKWFVESTASTSDLKSLIDLRDGTAHAADEAELEDRVLVAFVKHSDALVADLGRDREEFWGPQLPVVDALVMEARHKIQQRVAVKLEAAKASFKGRFAEIPPELLIHVRQMASPTRHSFFDEERAECPACGSFGIAYGDAEPEWDDDDSGGHHVQAIWWDAGSFTCRVCGLELESVDELVAAKMPIRWKIDGARFDEYWFGLDESELYSNYIKRNEAS